jgi:hypothetical protein
MGMRAEEPARQTDPSYRNDPRAIERLNEFEQKPQGARFLFGGEVCELLLQGFRPA